jgi:hypothetical protein
MGLRIALVTPFAWSQPHEVNDHVDGIARALRQLGHRVTVLAPSTRSTELRAGRKALQGAPGRGDADLPETVALGPAVPVSRRSSLGVPVGMRAALQLALARGGFDVVHGFEPGLPSLSYLALRDSAGLGVATFLSDERLGYPPGKAQREKLLGRIDALVATSPEVADAAAGRFPGDYRLVSPGIDLELFAPAPVKARRIVVEWLPGERPSGRAALRALAGLPGWELVVLRTQALAGRPTVPSALRGRVSVRTALDGASRAPILAEAAIFVPAPGGSSRLLLEAAACGLAIATTPGAAEQPALAAASLEHLAGDDALRDRVARDARTGAESQAFMAVAEELDGLYRSLSGRRRDARRSSADPLADREWIACDLHMHTSWSHDCQMKVSDLIDHAEAQGLGAIAITDHNVFGGAREAVQIAASRPLTVIPGEEVKTDGQGEVIGLFLEREIPRGMSFADTIAAIKEQGGLVYVPHPFDRLHAIPDPATLHRHLADIDVFEVYNARLLFEAYNDEALRFARKYNLTMGAGSDAHVLQGVGTGALRMRAFRDPEEFLVSLRTAEVLRRPKSLVYLQSLKWVAQAREKVRN